MSAPELVPAYEDLRSFMVEQRTGGGALPGLGLLLMRGMAAWVDVTSSSPAVVPPLAGGRGTPENQARLPAGAAGEVVNLLTSMTMAALDEVTI